MSNIDADKSDNSQPESKGPAKQKVNAEEASLVGPEAKRIKFALKYCQPSDKTRLKYDDCKALADALSEMEESGAAPVAPDGKIGGNGAILIESKIGDGGFDLVVSRSGKEAGCKLTEEDFVLVTKFCKEKWSVSYESIIGENQPTSDCPLLWWALKEAPKLYNWKSQPKCALHGHAIADKETAQKLGFPCSEKETLFSTLEDVEALDSLFEKFPYPDNHVYIRQNHGFFLLAENEKEVVELFRKLIKPNI